MQLLQSSSKHFALYGDPNDTFFFVSGMRSIDIRNLSHLLLTEIKMDSKNDLRIIRFPKVLHVQLEAESS